MTDLREDLGLILGSAIAGIAVFLSWFYESGLLSIIISVTLGVLLSLFVQKRTQKSEWKREYSIKVVEQVYGQLYGITKDFIDSKKRSEYQNWSFGFWDNVQKDHRYFMVDKKFRVRLDAFLQRVEKYNDTISELDYVILPKIISESAKTVFHEEPYENNVPNFHIDYMKGKYPSGTSFNLLNSLKKKLSLSDIINYELDSVHVDRAEISSVKLKINFRKDNTSEFVSLSSKDIKKFWEICLQKIGDNPEHQFVVKENDKLLEEAEEIKKELIKRIEEPWKI